MRQHRLGSLASILLVTGLLTVTDPGSQPGALASPAAVPAESAVPSFQPAPGDPLQPGEFYRDSSLSTDPPRGGWRVVGQGDGQTSTWTIDFDEVAARQCGNGHGPIMIGIVARDGHGPFGGHVLTARFFGFDNDKGYVPYLDLSGQALLTCFRAVDPSIPDGTAFTITTDRVGQWSPAGVPAADGHFDLVTNSNRLGYMVAQYQPGRGWLAPAPIGGLGFEPTVLRLPNGGLRIFVDSPVTQAMYTADISPDRRFLGWRNDGGALVSNAYPMLMPDGRISAFVAGTDHLLYQGRWSKEGQFLGWVHLGAPAGTDGVFGTPAAVSTGGGNVTVAVTDDRTHLYTRNYVHAQGWGPWTLLTGPHTAAQSFGLAAVSPGGGVVDLYWEGTESTNFEHVLTRRMVNGTWGPTFDLGGTVFNLFASYRDGRTDLWAQGGTPTSAAMYQRTNVTGHWSAWHALPYPRGYKP